MVGHMKVVARIINPIHMKMRRDRAAGHDWTTLGPDTRFCPYPPCLLELEWMKYS